MNPMQGQTPQPGMAPQDPQSLQGLDPRILQWVLQQQQPAAGMLNQQQPGPGILNAAQPQPGILPGGGGTNMSLTPQMIQQIMQQMQMRQQQAQQPQQGPGAGLQDLQQAQQMMGVGGR